MNIDVYGLDQTTANAILALKEEIEKLKLNTVVQTELTIDETFGANSNDLVVSQQAIKTYADTKISGAGVVVNNDIVLFDGTTGLALKDSGKSFPLNENDLLFTDITTLNSVSTKHGLLPKLSNTSTQFLNGQGNWATPSGTTNSYTTTAFTSQTSVTVTHSFGTYPIVSVFDSNGEVLIPYSIVHTSTNAFVVTFSIITTGTIISSVGSPQANTIISTAINYTILSSDKIIICTAFGKTITLPSAVGKDGFQYYIDNASAGNISLTTTSSQTINGLIIQIIPSDSAISVYSNGSNWRII